MRWPIIRWFLAYIYTTDHQSENVIGGKSLIDKNNKNLVRSRINLRGNVQDLYKENDKTLFKDIKEALNKWQDIPFTWMRKFNIVKVSSLPKWIYKFPIKNPTTLFIERDSQFRSSHGGNVHKIAKIFLKKNNDCVYVCGNLA